MSGPGPEAGGIPTGDLAISVRGLTKSFHGRKVVDDFAMDVPRGAIFGFLGPNGSGKTTTIRMMCGLLTPEAGEGTCLGHDIRRETQAIKARVGYMTQRFSLYEDLTIAENLDFMARMYGMADRRARVARALEDLGLADRAGQLAGGLSGGWKQRLSLAACLLHGPDLLMLDEPTAGVDPKARRDFWDEIRRLSARGVTVLVSTHYMDEAVQCDYIAYIAYGRKLIAGPAREIPALVGLSTWAVAVPAGRVAALETELRAQPAVAQVARFGTVLHVSGLDGPGLAALAAARGRADEVWTPVAGGLEEAFIWLMSRARDNFAGGGA